MATVARRLGDLKDEVVFVGGSVLALLVDDPAATPVRPTDDVDVVVDITTRPAYDALARKLLSLGFQPDTSEGAPLCRWIVENVVVDVMPTAGEVLGFENRWYPGAIAHANTRELAPGVTIRVATAPYFLAMKLEAFAGRGKADFMASHDLEDLIAVVDGNASVVDDVGASDEELKLYLADVVGELLDDAQFLATVPGHLAGDAASQARVRLVIARLRRIAGRE